MRTFAICLLSVVVVAALALGFTACGSSEKEIDATYQYVRVDTVVQTGEYEGVPYEMTSYVFTSDNVICYTDGSYMAVKTIITSNTDPGDDPMEVETAIRYGTFTKGTSTVDVDGTLIELKLNAATRVVWMADVYNGMFDKQADSDHSDEFPTTYIGDDVTQISRSQFMSDYGPAVTYYIVLDMDGNETLKIVDSM